ncbi:MAG: alpha-L-glutamate ligase [Anaeromyxobacteraceae bacterium]
MAPVAAAIRSLGGDWELLDLASIPRFASFTVGHDVGNGWSARIGRPGGGEVSSDEIDAIWWRRPRHYTLDPAFPAWEGELAFDQIHEGMVGVWSAMGARWVNHPWQDARASHKLAQLAVAHRLGVELPRTLVTTSGEEARRFLGDCSRRHVWKMLAPNPARSVPTQMVEVGPTGGMPQVERAPVLLQEYVEGVDLRVTVIGNEIFPAEIDARRTTSPNDFRPVFGSCRVGATTIPDALRAFILDAMSELGLAYAAFDFRRTGEGRDVFLEVNPAGQWLFIEQRTGQPISTTLARHLCRGD